MPYRCEIQSSIDATDLTAWRTLCGDDDLFVDPHFVRAVEHGLPHEASYYTAIVYDEMNQPQAIACFCVTPLDLAILAGEAVQKLAGWVRTVLPNALRYPAVFCGLPVSAGQSWLRMAANADRGELLRVLDEAARRLAKQHRARFVIFKEFSDAEVPELNWLTEHGYHRGESPPMNHLRADFANFAAYLAAIKAPYRSKIVRSQKKLQAAGLRTEVVTDASEIVPKYTDHAYGLYRAVVDKSPIKLETLSLEWFKQMALQFANESVWLAVYRGDELAAYAYGLYSKSTYYSLFGGVDYAINHETDAYFNLMYLELDFAFQRRVTDIQLGQTADDFKGRLGATQQARYFFVKPLKWKAALALRLAPEAALPKFPRAEERHVFQAKLA